ncbi:hypothetical protein F5880DRAFT_1618771 [Lentinula raphanica]|nr:hypothetical protein F5880DRAFT_1618771 [Lentinula raphanica]
MSASGVGRSSNPWPIQGTNLLLQRRRTRSLTSHDTTPTAPDASNNEKLNADIVTKAALIRAHENAMSQVQQNITCQICLDLFYKPYALAAAMPHASGCYSCLVSWFSRPTGEGADQLPVYRQKKCCAVHIVERLSVLKSGLLGGLPSPLGSGAEGSRRDIFPSRGRHFLATILAFATKRMVVSIDA